MIPKIKSKTLHVLWLIFAFLNLADAITAFFILPGEANPLYLSTGSIWPVIGIKILIVGLSYLLLTRKVYPNKAYFYMFINILIFSSILMMLGVASNVYGIMNPETLEAASQVSDADKSQTYNLFVGVVYLLPMLISFVVFLVYNKARKRFLFKRKK